MSQQYNPHEKIKSVQLIAPADYLTTTDTHNVAVDTKGFNFMILQFDLGIVGDVTLDFDIQQSDAAAASFATLPEPVDNEINPRKVSFANADDNTSPVAFFSLDGLKRYIKPVDTLNANSAMYGLTAVLYGPEEAATTQSFEADAT